MLQVVPVTGQIIHHVIELEEFTAESLLMKLYGVKEPPPGITTELQWNILGIHEEGKDTVWYILQS